MKMKEKFNLPLGAFYRDLHEDVEVNGAKAISTFDTESQAYAASIAINQYDAAYMLINRSLLEINRAAQSYPQMLTPEVRKHVEELKSFLGKGNELID